MVLQNGGILPQHYTASSKPRKPWLGLLNVPAMCKPFKHPGWWQYYSWSLHMAIRFQIWKLP
jgi:hypothetical protein